MATSTNDGPNPITVSNTLDQFMDDHPLREVEGYQRNATYASSNVKKFITEQGWVISKLAAYEIDKTKPWLLVDHDYSVKILATKQNVLQPGEKLWEENKNLTDTEWHAKFRELTAAVCLQFNVKDPYQSLNNEWLREAISGLISVDNNVTLECHYRHNNDHHFIITKTEGQFSVSHKALLKELPNKLKAAEIEFEEQVKNIMPKVVELGIDKTFTVHIHTTRTVKSYKVSDDLLDKSFVNGVWEKTLEASYESIKPIRVERVAVVDEWLDKANKTIAGIPTISFVKSSTNPLVVSIEVNGDYIEELEMFAGDRSIELKPTWLDELLLPADTIKLFTRLKKKPEGMRKWMVDWYNSQISLIGEEHE